MNTRPEKDLQQRIFQLLDGELTADEVTSLDAELRADRESRALYLQVAALHSALQDRYASMSQSGHLPLISVPRLLARQRQRMVRFSMLAAALILLAPALALWFIMASANKSPIASFQVAPDSSFSITHGEDGEATTGNLLRVGSRLRLSRGTMEAEFETGVRCVIEAPCDLVILSRNSISLAKGLAWFDVPHAASGFTVETSQLKVVDIGTQFGVVALPGDWHEIHVTKGSVEVSCLNAGTTPKLTLSDGQARRMNALGKLVETPFDGGRFTTAIAKRLVVRNADFDVTDSDEDDKDPAGYGPIFAWGTSGYGVGISDRSKPFLNQAAHSGAQVAFIQGRGTISQTVTGFDPDKRYTVTYFVSERGLPGAATSTSVSLDLGASSYNSPGNISRTDAFRRIVSEPLKVFGPTANIEIKANKVSGDAALLVDSVSISRAVPSVPDGGFEYPILPAKTFKQAVGGGAASLAESAWMFSKGAGITTNGSNFAPQSTPEGSQAAVFQSHGAAIEGTLHGFEPGARYRLRFAAAGRKGGAANMHILIGTDSLRFDGSESFKPDEGDYQPFISDEFQASEETGILRIHATGDGTTFLDDLHFEFIAEPGEKD